MDQLDLRRVANKQGGIRRRIWVEVVSWFWVIIAFIGIEGDSKPYYGTDHREF